MLPFRFRPSDHTTGNQPPNCRAHLIMTPPMEPVKSRQILNLLLYLHPPMGRVAGTLIRRLLPPWVGGMNERTAPLKGRPPWKTNRDEIAVPCHPLLVRCYQCAPSMAPQQQPPGEERRVKRCRTENIQPPPCFFYSFIAEIELRQFSRNYCNSVMRTKEIRGSSH